jgi:hypothetical protein
MNENSHKYFWGHKHILSQGRELEVGCEASASGTVYAYAALNHRDVVHEMTKPLLVHMQWDAPAADPQVSLECRGGRPLDGRPLSESEKPLDGLNGEEAPLRFSELAEIFDFLGDVHRKVRDRD